MLINPTATNITTMLLIAITAWVIHSRLRRPLESNWPLFYYIAVVAYSKTFQDVFSPYAVYVGVVCGLLLRFEFMGGFVLQAVRFIELCILCYFIWQCAGLIFWW